MAGEWIPEKARGLLGMFPGQWSEVQTDVWQGRCPGEHAHTNGKGTEQDCRIYTSYGADGKKPGIYCFHNGCKGMLDSLNEEFRNALFAKDPNFKPGPTKNAGVVSQAPRPKEAWIPDYSEAKLKAVVLAVPEVGPEWFAARSKVDPAGVTPGEFLEHAFLPGDRVLIFTDYKSQGNFLWQVGKGGYRLSEQREVTARRSALPNDGGKDGAWYLCNPVDGLWHPNPRRQGMYSRRSLESVTAWRHMVLESDEAPADLWLRFLAMAPLAIVAIYSSGGRSWHALVRVNMETKANFDTLLRNFAKRTLPLLGADPAAMTPVRLTRLPGCTRGGRMQQLIYLNPLAVEKPILNLRVLRETGKAGE
jgi:hypothetical protein